MKTIQSAFNITRCLTITGTIILFSCKGGGDSGMAVAGTEFKTHGQSGVVDKDSKKNILQIAAGSEDHTTLAAACKAADLLDVLANAGPLTVFAPTNAAFEKLPSGTVEELLKPENKEKLATIIKFHAAPGSFRVGSGLKDGMKLYMATGHYIDVEVREDGTYVYGSKVLASIEASNGIVHVVDDVYLPPAEE